MESHFLNLLRANTTLFSVGNKGGTPFTPLDLPSTKGSVPAKTRGCSSPGERGHPSLADKAPLQPTGTNRESEKSADKNFMGRETDEELSKIGKKYEKHWVGEE